ncbi:VOC family protein [Patescibacteria group bacterium]|nr:VOC family protein [Patescibacteria group bacterium]
MKIQIKRLDHVQLAIPIGGEERAREFYGGILGLAEVEKPAELKKNGGLWYEVAGIGLHLGAEEPQARSKRHPAFKVENLEAVRAYLKENGAEIKEEVQIEGIERFSFYDWFGNRIEFFEQRHI